MSATLAIIGGLAGLGKRIAKGFRKPDAEGVMHDTDLMRFTKGLGRTGMGLGIGMGATKWKQKQFLEQQEKMNALQFEQAKELQGLQVSGQKEMMDYNQQLGLNTWRETASPQAKVQQFKEAGLNTGLMYGGGGSGGGATIPSGGGVSGQGTQIAPELDAGMALQLAMGMQKTQAEIENIKANTTNTEANTENTKQDTILKEMLEQKGYAEMNKIAAETTNEQLKSELLEIQKKIDGIKSYVDDQSKESKIREAAAAADKLDEEGKRLRNENNKFAETYERAATAAKLELVKVIAETIAINAGTEFKYGTSAEILRWMKGGADVIRAFYPALNIDLGELETLYETETETKETPTGKKTKKTTTKTRK